MTAQWFGVRGTDTMGGATGPTIGPTPSQWMDGSDVWHPWAEVLVDPSDVDPTTYQSTLRFPSSYVSGDVWVSGVRAPMDMTSIFPTDHGTVSSMQFAVHLNVAVILLTLDADHRGGAHGILSGVLPTQALFHSLTDVAVAISTSFCGGSTIDSILQEIDMASDIGADGTQDPTKTCDGISIGLGFTTKPATLGAPEMPFVDGDPCAMP